MLQFLTIQKPVVVFDLETTGLRIGADRIIEFGAVRIEPGHHTRELSLLVNPGITIPSQAVAIHGISDADVADCPLFAEVSETIRAFLDGADLAGFNLRRFDLPFLVEEFRHTQRPLDLRGRMVVDVQDIFHRQEPRDLKAAVRRFCGRPHSKAHSAMSNARATASVLDAMIDHYHELPRDIVGLYQELVSVDLGGWFEADLPGQFIFTRGKHRGFDLARVARNDPSYLRWVASQAILPDARSMIRRALREAGNG